ncbi:unnamed protein product, partial [Scytosiphon promiscuus]
AALFAASPSRRYLQLPAWLVCIVFCVHACLRFHGRQMTSTLFRVDSSRQCVSRLLISCMPYPVLFYCCTCARYRQFDSGSGTRYRVREISQLSCIILQQVLAGWQSSSVSTRVVMCFWGHCN